MTSRVLGRLMGLKRMLWLCNRDFKVYQTHWMLLILHARQFEKLEQPEYSQVSVYCKILSGATSKVLAGRFRPAGRMSNTLSL